MEDKPTGCSWWIWVEGDEDSLRLLREVLGDHPGLRFEVRDGRTEFQAASLEGRMDQSEVTIMAERFVSSAAGVLTLFAGAPGDLAVKGISWHDWQNPSRSGSLTLRAMRIGSKIDASKLLERTGQDETVGSFLIGRAEVDWWLGMVFGLLAEGGGWGMVYNLLELLKHHYKTVFDLAGGWRDIFEALSDRHGVSKRRIKEN